MRALQLQKPAAFRIDHDDAISLVKYKNTARQRIKHLLQCRSHAVVLVQTARQCRIPQLPAGDRDTMTPVPTMQQ